MDRLVGSCVLLVLRYALLVSISKQELVKARWKGLKRRFNGVPVWVEFWDECRLNVSLDAAWEAWVEGGRKSVSTPCVLKAEGYVKDWVWGPKSEALRKSGLKGARKRPGLIGVVERGPKERPFCVYVKVSGKQIKRRTRDFRVS